MQIINAGGVVYLGKRDGDKIVGVELKNQGIRNAINEHIKADNAGELIVVELDGQIAVATKPLKKEDKRFLKERLALMQEVKLQATEVLENHLFDNDGQL